MGEGRGSAGVAILFCLIIITMIMAHTSQVHAATYTVGGPGGWTFNVVGWPKGKTFKAGDTIIFNYDATIHNVVVVNRGGYRSCRTPAGAKVYKSGKDQVKLVKGLNFFICNVASHCESGMKIAINAA